MTVRSEESGGQANQHCLALRGQAGEKDKSRELVAEVGRGPGCYGFCELPG